MTVPPIEGPILLVGCGRLGSAIVEGWLEFGPVEPRQLMILTPSSKAICDLAESRGSLINPPVEMVSQARVVVLAVKPAVWRQVANNLPVFSPDTVIVSVMAGVTCQAIENILHRPVARAMPTTAVAKGQGVAAIWSAAPGPASLARGLLACMADVVELAEESQIDVATAVSGSGPAYVHAFTLALASAGLEAGLTLAQATRLARGAVRSAAAASYDDALEDLIGRIASPGGTTQAGLKAASDAGLDRVAQAAVMAALRRARELASS